MGHGWLPSSIRSEARMTSHYPDQSTTAIAERKPREESPRDFDERLRVIFENITQGIVTSDLDGHLLYWNRAALEMHGFTNSDELRLHLSKFTDFFELSTLDGRVVKFEDWPMARLLR